MSQYWFKDKMLNSQNLINKICAKIACGGLTELETCQTNGALNILSNPVVSVATFSALPNPITYAGRLIYVDDENRYYHAVGVNWINKLDSQIFSYENLIWSWGCNGQGRLGDNTTTNSSSPVSVVGNFTDWCQISAGDHSLGVRQNGTAWAWGAASSGQLGDNCTVSRSSPVSVVGNFTDWCQVSAGGSHSLGLRTNGSIWSWGVNIAGRLGDNTVINRSSPVSVVGNFTDWCQVSAGTNHSLGIRINGTLWAWGNNDFGRLGDGSGISRSSPVSVVGGFTDWRQVDGGGSHSVGLRVNGTLWAWGYNGSGRLGDNTTISKTSPVSVVGGFTDWCQVSAGYFHNLGVRSDGTLWGWGGNTAGNIGDGTQTSRSSPVSVVGGFTNWCQVSVDRCHSLGVRTNGTVWAWGCNGVGRLGDNTTTNRSSPISVIGGITNWCQVSAGYGHNLGIRSICKGF
jgi:alpha-tubulin suppressor-like RCC1 family protein